MIEAYMREEVCNANKELQKMGLVLFTWGNVSAINRETGIIAIKPSGVDYDKLSPDKIVLLNLSGDIIEGSLNPSSDTPTLLELYKNFKEIKAVVHTHSTYATAFAQANMPLKCLGTTHADHFYGDVPLIPELENQKIKNNYELNIGLSITNYFEKNNINPLNIPACLCSRHGPFAWGDSAMSAVKNIAILEKVAEMNQLTLSINSQVESIKQSLLDKHYLRKNGAKKYYGQETFNNNT